MFFRNAYDLPRGNDESVVGWIRETAQKIPGAKFTDPELNIPLDAKELRFTIEKKGIKSYDNPLAGYSKKELRQKVAELRRSRSAEKIIQKSKPIDDMGGSIDDPLEWREIHFFGNVNKTNLPQKFDVPRSRTVSGKPSARASRETSENGPNSNSSLNDRTSDFGSGPRQNGPLPDPNEDDDEKRPEPPTEEETPGGVKIETKVSRIDPNEITVDIFKDYYNKTSSGETSDSLLDELTKDLTRKKFINYTNLEAQAKGEIPRLKPATKELEEITNRYKQQIEAIKNSQGSSPLSPRSDGSNDPLGSDDYHFPDGDDGAPSQDSFTPPPDEISADAKRLSNSASEDLSEYLQNFINQVSRENTPIDEEELANWQAVWRARNAGYAELADADPLEIAARQAIEYSAIIDGESFSLAAFLSSGPGAAFIALLSIIFGAAGVGIARYIYGGKEQIYRQYLAKEDFDTNCDCVGINNDDNLTYGTYCKAWDSSNIYQLMTNVKDKDGNNYFVTNRKQGDILVINESTNYTSFEIEIIKDPVYTANQAIRFTELATSTCISTGDYGFVNPFKKNEYLNVSAIVEGAVIETTQAEKGNVPYNSTFHVEYFTGCLGTISIHPIHDPTKIFYVVPTDLENDSTISLTEKKN